MRKSIENRGLNRIAELYSVAISQVNQCWRDRREPIRGELSA